MHVFDEDEDTTALEFVSSDAEVSAAREEVAEARVAVSSIFSAKKVVVGSGDGGATTRN